MAEDRMMTLHRVETASRAMAYPSSLRMRRTLSILHADPRSVRLASHIRPILRRAAERAA
jgi:hypothetical protein